jgi:acyl carrier protein
MTNQKVRTIVLQHAKLSIEADALTDDSDLYDAGMSSHASVHLMLALENEFDIEFPDSLLTRDVFRSVGAIGAAVERLKSSA